MIVKRREVQACTVKKAQLYLLKTNEQESDMNSFTVHNDNGANVKNKTDVISNIIQNFEFIEISQNLNAVILFSYSNVLRISIFIFYLSIEMNHLQFKWASS